MAQLRFGVILFECLPGFEVLASNATNALGCGTWVPAGWRSADRATWQSSFINPDCERPREVGVE